MANRASGTMLIHVHSVIQSDAAITFDLGVRVREAYGDAWRDESIELDFAGIRNVTPSFLSQAVSPIIRAFPPEQLSAHLTFKDVPPPFELSWNKVQQAAARIRLDQ
jgi:hypothetical protein